MNCQLEHFAPLCSAQQPHSTLDTSERERLEQVSILPEEALFRLPLRACCRKLHFSLKCLKPLLSSDSQTRNIPYPIHPTGRSDRPATMDSTFRHPEGCVDGTGRPGRGLHGSGTQYGILSSVRFFRFSCWSDQQPIFATPNLFKGQPPFSTRACLA